MLLRQFGIITKVSMSEVSLNQFKGCLIGLLVGDCLGFPYENESSSYYPLSNIRKDLAGIKEGSVGTSCLTRTGRKQYTDDTSMTISVSKFLLESSPSDSNLDYRDLAERFYNFYINEPLERSYGSHVHKVFQVLKTTNFIDAFQPASEQFNGQGSLGNGSGMRVAPIALFTIADPDATRLVDITTNVSRITHTHPVGVVGGIFQALAVRQGLLLGAQKSPGKGPVDILDSFEKEFMLVVKQTKTPCIQNGWKVYADRIKSIRKFIEGGVKTWTLDDVRKELGVKVTSAESIPTGLFCFLAAFEDCLNSQTENHFERTIELALALGGDTDTVGAMAGSICGAYVGYEGIAKNFLTSCEDFEGILELAEALYKNYEKLLQKN